VIWITPTAAGAIGGKFVVGMAIALLLNSRLPFRHPVPPGGGFRTQPPEQPLPVDETLTRLASTYGKPTYD